MKTHFSLIVTLLSLFIFIPKTVQEITPEMNQEQEIMFISDRDGKSDLYTMNFNGLNIRRVVDSDFEEGGEIVSADLSPDGHFLVFSSDKERLGIENLFTTEIFLLDMQTLNIRSITTIEKDGRRNNSQPIWSLCCLQFAYLGNGVEGDYGQVYTFDIETDEKNLLMNGDIGAVRQIDWSPDGSQLVISAFSGLPEAHLSLFIINADGSNLQQITPNDLLAAYPAWATDDMIYFVCGRSQDICRLSVNNEGVEQLTNFKDESLFVHNLDVSEKDQLIFQKSRNGAVYQLNPDDGSLTKLSEANEFTYKLLNWTRLYDANT